jgi:PAS domain S-box-containing protein
VDAIAGGRPAPNTAINFLLMGSALLVLGKRQYRAAQGLSLGVFLIALLALTGHLYTVTEIYQVGSPTGMAIHTAVSFLLLALGILAATADQGWMRNLSSSQDGGVMMRRLLPLILLAPPFIGLAMLLNYENLIRYPERAVALRSILTTCLFSAVIWWNGRSLNRIDAQREAIQQQFTDELEAQVAARTAELAATNQALRAENARRQQAEASLRESETRMRRAITFAPFPIVIHAEDGQILAISRTLTEITGYTAKEIPTIADWTERACGERQAIAQEVIDRLYDIDDRVHDGEFEVRTKTDETRFWDFSSAPLGRMTDGRRLVISIAADITDRKHMEIELAASRTQLQRQLAELETIYQSAPIGLNVLDRDLRFVRINERLAKINGYSVEAHIGRSVRELLPDLADTAEALLRPILETGEPVFDVEIHGETPAQPGVQRIWRESFLPLREGDRVIGINTVCEEITERRRTQLALQAAQLQLDVALEAGAVYPWRLNLQANQAVTNPKLGKLFGLDPAAATAGFPLEQGMAVIHKADRPLVEQALQAAISTGRNYKAEFRICPPNGEEKWVLSRGKVNFDAEGNPQALVGVTVDITERKAIEANLRKTFTRLNFVLSASQIGTWEVNLQSQPFVAEPRSLRHDQIYGYDSLQPEWSYDVFMSHVHPDDRDLVAERFAHSVETLTNWHVECRIIRTDGATCWVDISGNIYQDPNQQSVQLIGLIADITARKQNEQALAARAAQQAEVALIGQQALANENLDDFLQSVTERVAAVLNVEYCKLLELLPDEQGFFLRAGMGWQKGLVGHTIVPGGRDSQSGYTLLSQVPTVVEDLRTDERFNGPELLNLHGVVSGMSTVIGDLENHPFGVIGVHTRSQRRFTENDVNFLQAIANILAESVAQQRSQQEIQQINASLEQRIEERTQQLVEVNQELEAFAYSVSHDLRAPLRAVEGLARIFQEDYNHCLDETGQEYAQMMIDSASQMDQLIQDLLAYSRLGRRDVVLAPVNLKAVVDESLQNLAPVFAEITEQEPDIQLDPLPEVIAQRSVLRQVLTNLLTNAVKFVDSATRPTLHIWAEDRNSQVRLWIKDNGIGIDERHRERVFQPFERLHGIEAYPGTGIGLAIVQRGVERMGGKVGVESTPGEGSQFWIELPRP